MSEEKNQLFNGDKKNIARGCVVYMKPSSGCIGYGNPQCVSSVCEPLDEIGLYGHNQHYKIYDIDRILISPTEKQSSELREKTIQEVKEVLLKNLVYVPDEGVAYHITKMQMAIISLDKLMDK